MRIALKKEVLRPPFTALPTPRSSQFRGVENVDRGNCWPCFTVSTAVRQPSSLEDATMVCSFLQTRMPPGPLWGNHLVTLSFFSISGELALGNLFGTMSWKTAPWTLCLTGSTSKLLQEETQHPCPPFQ